MQRGDFRKARHSSRRNAGLDGLELDFREAYNVQPETKINQRGVRLDSYCIASFIVGSLSATLWAFLLTVTKVSRYVPYDLLVK